MLEESDLLLQLLRELGELIFCQHVLLFVRADCLAFIVVETGTFALGDNLRRVIEEHTC